MLSQQTFRLTRINFPAESCGYELIISAENNANGKLGDLLSVPIGLMDKHADDLAEESDEALGRDLDG